MTRLAVGASATMASLAILVLSAGLASAQARPDVRSLTCGEAQALVQRSGGIVLTTGRYTYDRFVPARRACPPGQIGRRTWVQTSDTPSCSIGYVCVLDTEREDRFWRPRW